MASPPPKKQRRLIVLSSEDESENPETAQNGANVPPRKLISVQLAGSKRLPTRPASTTAPSQKSVSARSTPTSSPKKTSKAGAKAKKAGSIYSFFNAVTQTQTQKPTEVGDAPRKQRQEEDVIDDDSDTTTSKVSPIPRRTREPSVNSLKRVREISPVKGVPPKATQKFNISTTQAIRTSNARDDSRPWAEKYGPVNLEELAVHKKKVADVRTWLEDVFHGRARKRLLVLKGPSGSGKTATIAALARPMGFEVAEWKNPSGSTFGSDGFSSLTAQFEEFLGRSGQYGSLSLEQIETDQTTPTPPPAEKPKKAVLLEDFPNALRPGSTTSQAFRSIVLQYLASSVPTAGAFFSRQSHDANITPLIMVISETLITSSTAASDSFTAHRLLGPQVLGHPGVTIIEFNTIAPTLLVKALNLVIQKEARQSGRRRTPGPAVIKSLAEVGDIRSAIGSLEFLCLRGDKDGDWGGRVAAKGKTGANNAVALTKMEKQSIELITQRESTLDIFHAVGKVVYNKRKTPAEAGVEPPEKPPEHLVQFHRPLIPEVDVERLMDETGTDIETFLAALHENYVLSCDGDDALDSLVGCIDALSDSDVLITNRAATGGGFGNFYQSNFQGGGLDLLRQSELSFHVAVRGIQFALPHPVKRRAQPGPGGARDAFKMFYPTSMRLWKQEQEVTGLVDAWADLSLARTSSMAATTGVVESWKNKNSNLLSAKDLRESECSAPQASFLLGSSSARAEMLLERLPYIAKITRQSKDSARTTELQRITKFEGIQPAPEDVEVEDEASREFGSDLVGIPRASDVTSAGFSNAVPTGKAIQELIIAEDDIEDD